MSRGIRFVIAVVALAAGTWLAGWWAVPAIALVLGVVGTRPSLVAIAAAVAWLALLGLDAAGGGITRVSTTLAGVIGLPAPVLFLVTLLFPALAAWSAASVADAARSLRPTSRQPS